MAEKKRVRNINVREDLDAMIVAIADHYGISYSDVVHGILLDWQESDAKNPFSVMGLVGVLMKSKKDGE